MESAQLDLGKPPGWMSQSLDTNSEGLAAVGLTCNKPALRAFRPFAKPTKNFVGIGMCSFARPALLGAHHRVFRHGGLFLAEECLRS